MFNVIVEQENTYIISMKTLIYFFIEPSFVNVRSALKARPEGDVIADGSRLEPRIVRRQQDLVRQLEHAPSLPEFTVQGRNLDLKNTVWTWNWYILEAFLFTNSDWLMSLSAKTFF